MKPYDKAQQGLQLLKESILELLAQKPNGLRNSEIAEELGIHSDYLGGQEDYLSWSVLGLLLKETKVIRKGKQYFVSPD